LKSTGRRRRWSWVALAVVNLCQGAAAQSRAAESVRDAAAADYQRQQARERALQEQLLPTPNVHLDVPAAPGRETGFPREQPCFPIAIVRAQGVPADAPQGWDWLLNELPQGGSWEMQPRCLAASVRKVSSA